MKCLSSDSRWWRREVHSRACVCKLESVNRSVTRRSLPSVWLLGAVW